MRKLSQEEAIKRLYEKHPTYDFSQFTYINARTPSTVTCEMGHTWKVCYYSSMTGCGCPECAQEIKSKKRRLDKNTAIENLKKIHPNYDFSEFIYKNAKSKGKVKCSKGHIWFSSYDKLMIGRGCLECITRTQADAIKTLYEKRPEYDFSKFIYNGSVCKSTVVCDKGHTFKIRYSKIMEGVGCPICNTSKGEYKIRRWLLKNNINFEAQKTFNDAKYKFNLRWDFFLPQYNVLIEYNGRQHYEFVARWHKDLIGFRTQMERDLLKEKYAYEHGIKQLVISYENFDDIEQILSNYLVVRQQSTIL